MPPDLGYTPHKGNGGLRRIGELSGGVLWKIKRRIERAAARALAYVPHKGLRLDLLSVLAAVAKYQARKFKAGVGKKRWGGYRLYDEHPTVWCTVRQLAIIEWYQTGLAEQGQIGRAHV